MDNFDPYNVLLSIATNIPQRLKTAFVLQGHIGTNLQENLDQEILINMGIYYRLFSSSSVKHKSTRGWYYDNIKDVKSLFCPAEIKLLL